jgi:hypothetical protein
MRNDFREEFENNEEAITDMTKLPAFLAHHRSEHSTMAMRVCIAGDAISHISTFASARKFKCTGNACMFTVQLQPPYSDSPGVPIFPMVSMNGIGGEKL